MIPLGLRNSSRITLHSVFSLLLWVVCSSLMLTSCNQDRTQAEVALKSDSAVEDYTPKNRNWVGDITFNELLDQSDFYICDSSNIYQYHNLGVGLPFDKDKAHFRNYINTNFKYSKETSQNGLFRVRFLVNCKGETSRWRALSADFDYQVFEFDPALSNELLQLVKDYKGWKPVSYKGKPVDYYMYIIFKIQNGRITEILP